MTGKNIVTLATQAAIDDGSVDRSGTFPGGDVVDLARIKSEPEALAAIPEDYAVEHLALALDFDGPDLRVAVPDLADVALLAELRVMVRGPIKAVAAPARQLEVAVRERYRVLAGVEDVVRDFQSQDTLELDRKISDAVALTEHAPVVKIVNLLLTQGLRDRASDIHIEPKKDHLRVRFRIDGVLTDVVKLPIKLAAGIASRIKVMSELDIVERHRSQDGQIQMQLDNRFVDIRVSTVETIWGEKVVLRLLDKSRTILRLEELGCRDAHYRQLNGVLKAPFGMVLVSGPTGSGKTTTLYAAVNELDAVGRNITTIEDPVEYTFEDLNQVQIRKMSQITFANGLRAILRQDPDVILIGEIRDIETAEIAVHSALTGHLVLSSLHATDAAGVLQRFMEMGIEGFLISSSVTGVVAQRLVRRICDHCRVTYQLSPEEAALHRSLSGRPEVLFSRGSGCAHCSGTGYRGRVGVFEVLVMTDAIKQLIADKATVKQVRDQATADGMLSMREDAVAKVDEGVTTMAEVIRSVYLT